MSYKPILSAPAVTQGRVYKPNELHNLLSTSNVYPMSSPAPPNMVKGLMTVIAREAGVGTQGEALARKTISFVAVVATDQNNPQKEALYLTIAASRTLLVHENLPGKTADYVALLTVAKAINPPESVWTIAPSKASNIYYAANHTDATHILKWASAPGPLVDDLATSPITLLFALYRTLYDNEESNEELSNASSTLEGKVTFGYRPWTNPQDKNLPWTLEDLQLLGHLLAYYFVKGKPQNLTISLNKRIQAARSILGADASVPPNISNDMFSLIGEHGSLYRDIKYHFVRSFFTDSQTDAIIKHTMLLTRDSEAQTFHLACGFALDSTTYAHIFPAIERERQFLAQARATFMASGTPTTRMYPTAYGINIPPRASYPECAALAVHVRAQKAPQGQGFNNYMGVREGGNDLYKPFALMEMGVGASLGNIQDLANRVGIPINDAIRQYNIIAVANRLLPLPIVQGP